MVSSEKNSHMKQLFLLVFILVTVLPELAIGQSAKQTENRKLRMVTVENGRKAPLGNFVNLEGEIHKFDDFRGKLIVVDFWASWCGPCIQQTPYFEALAEKFQDEEVVFLKVSIDQKQSFWQKYIAERNWTHNSYWIGTDEQNPIYPFVYTEYDDKSFRGIVTAVPRYVIISKEGNIIDNHAIHPSHPRLAKDIKYYLRK